MQTLRLRPRPIGQPHFFQHLPQCIIISSGLAQAQVFGQREIENIHLLRQIAHFIAGQKIGKIPPVEFQTALQRRKLTGEHIEQSGFAHARGACNQQGLAAFQHKVHMLRAV